jgi:hypothetical protein
MPHMTRDRLKRSLALAAVGALTVTPSAFASQRFASANSADGVGSCSALAPCSLAHAINDAAAGDEVVVAPGTYAVGSEISAPVPVHVRGVPGQPRPRIIGASNLGSDVLTLENGGSLGYLYVEANQALMDAIDIDTAVAYNVDLGSPATMRGATLLRDSLILVTGSDAAIQTKTSKVAPGETKILGATVVSSGADGTAIKVKVHGTTIRNSIVRGGDADIDVYSNSSATVDHSNFRPALSSAYTDGGANQSADPRFVDPARGNLRLLADSPAIDAGTPDPNLGGADADGMNRVAGAAPDLGAYEGGSSPAPVDAFTPGTTPTGGGAAPEGSDTRPGNGRPHELPPTASPVAGSRVNVAPVTGAVRVRPPGSNSFVALEEGASVPVNSVVDATNGVVSLTSATGTGDGESQTGRFWGGRFRVVQSADGDRYTNLVLSGSGFKACKRLAARGKLSASGKRRVRRLWGQDRGGRFRTRGRRGQATVRGTLWLTEDRCDGTLFKVREGAITVKAKGKRKPIVLRAGKRYLAR